MQCINRGDLIMAKEIAVEIPAWRHWVVIAGLGAVSGAAVMVLTWLLGRYVVEPLVCGSGIAAQCAASADISANVSAVIVAVLGVWLAVQLAVARPLFVVVGVTLLVWGFGGWLAGLLWIEALLWAIVIYTLAYLLCVWISRQRVLWVAAVSLLVIVVAERIVLALY